jgi:hypothetical protein
MLTLMGVKIKAKFGFLPQLTPKYLDMLFCHGHTDTDICNCAGRVTV